jgi:TorA maturation chaperone TorD
MGTTAARTEIYLTLSEIFKPPSPPFSAQLFSGAVKKNMDGWLETLGFTLVFPDAAYSSTEEEFIATLKSEYNSLFEGPVIPFFPLVESVYKPWDASGGSILGADRGYIMGDSALAMIERYKNAGISIPKSYSHQPDHLALLLEYMASTIDKTSGVDQLRFINTHLDWMGNILAEIEENSNSAHYPAFIRFLKSYINEDSKRLEELTDNPVS